MTSEHAILYNLNKETCPRPNMGKSSQPCKSELHSLVRVKYQTKYRMRTRPRDSLEKHLYTEQLRLSLYAYFKTLPVYTTRQLHPSSLSTHFKTLSLYTGQLHHSSLPIRFKTLTICSWSSYIILPCIHISNHWQSVQGAVTSLFLPHTFQNIDSLYAGQLHPFSLSTYFKTLTVFTWGSYVLLPCPHISELFCGSYLLIYSFNTAELGLYDVNTIGKHLFICYCQTQQM